eukprot:SAG31_NODE_1139_length_9713_cov_28.936863_8_plen_48_part_00
MLLLAVQKLAAGQEEKQQGDGMARRLARGGTLARAERGSQVASAVLI